MRAAGVRGALRVAWHLLRRHYVVIYAKPSGGLWSRGFATMECETCDKLIWLIWTEC